MKVIVDDFAVSTDKNIVTDSNFLHCIYCRTAYTTSRTNRNLTAITGNYNGTLIQTNHIAYKITIDNSFCLAMFEVYFTIRKSKTYSIAIKGNHMTIPNFCKPILGI